MGKRGFLGLVGAAVALVTLLAWWRGGVVVGVVSGLVTIAAATAGLLTHLRAHGPSRVRWPVVTLVVVATLSVSGAVRFAPVSFFDRAAPKAAPTVTVTTPPVTVTPTPPVVTETSDPPTAPATTPPPPAETVPPELAEYCELSLEFLAMSQEFSGKGWTGKIAKSDFDPLVRNATAARDIAPHEMRAPMTVLASSYKAARDGWSDSILTNLGVATGTILSPSARAAADQVDAYDSEHCG